MKKILSLVICLALATTMLTACNNAGNNNKGVKTGLAVISSAAKSSEATTEANGKVQVDSNCWVFVDDKVWYKLYN